MLNGIQRLSKLSYRCTNLGKCHLLTWITVFLLLINFFHAVLWKTCGFDSILLVKFSEMNFFAHSLLYHRLKESLICFLLLINFKQNANLVKCLYKIYYMQGRVCVICFCVFLCMCLYLCVLNMCICSQYNHLYSSDAIHCKKGCIVVL